MAHVVRSPCIIPHWRHSECFEKEYEHGQVEVRGWHHLPCVVLPPAELQTHSTGLAEDQAQAEETAGLIAAVIERGEAKVAIGQSLTPGSHAA